MSPRTLGLDNAVYDYLVSVSLRESDVMRRLRDETMALSEANMQTAPEQAQFMAVLVELLGARRILEIGTFTGYSALAMASALPSDGKLVCLDVSEEWTAIGRRYWREADVDRKIDLRLSSGIDGIARLLKDEASAGTFDMAFIDADKENYPVYYEGCIDLLRPGGLLMIDNVLWGGSVADPGDMDKDTEAIRAVNRMAHADGRVSISLVPIGDGLMLCRKR